MRERNYSYQPDEYVTHFSRSETEGITMGIEIETDSVDIEVEVKHDIECEHVISNGSVACDCGAGDTKHADKSAMLEAMDDVELPFYAKSDSSLSNGCEFVSHPMTLAYVRRKNSIEEWEKWRKAVISNGFRAWDQKRAGIHIHTPISAWSTGQLYRLKFLLYNIEDFCWFWGNRDDSARHYCQLETTKTLATSAKLRSEGERNRVWNFSGKRTLEFRFFRSTTKITTLLSYFELIDAMHTYTKECNLSSIRMKGNDTNVDRKEYYGLQFKMFLLNNADMYPNCAKKAERWANTNYVPVAPLGKKYSYMHELLNAKYSQVVEASGIEDYVIKGFEKGILEVLDGENKTHYIHSTEELLRKSEDLQIAYNDAEYAQSRTAKQAMELLGLKPIIKSTRMTTDMEFSTPEDGSWYRVDGYRGDKVSEQLSKGYSIRYVLIPNVIFTISEVTGRMKTHLVTEGEALCA